MKIIYKIISNFINNKSLYIGEKVTVSEHMIQSAMLAEKAKCNDDLICACFNQHSTNLQQIRIRWSAAHCKPSGACKDHRPAS